MYLRCISKYFQKYKTSSEPIPTEQPPIDAKTKLLISHVFTTRLNLIAVIKHGRTSIIWNQQFLTMKFGERNYQLKNKFLFFVNKLLFQNIRSLFLRCNSVIMHWEDVLDTALFTSLINTCKSTVEKCSIKADNPKNSKEFDGKLSLGDTYLLFHNLRERKVLQLSNVNYQHSQYQVKTGVFSSGTVHRLQFSEDTVVSVLHGDNYQVLSRHLGSIIGSME